MRGFRDVADALGWQLGLEAVIPDLDNPGEALRSIAEMASAAGARFGAVAVSPAGDLDFVIPGSVFDDMSPYGTLYSAAREAFPGCAIGGGNFMYFTELNRKPPPFDGLDFVIHPTCAIVHAADDRSVTETVRDASLHHPFRTVPVRRQALLPRSGRDRDPHQPLRRSARAEPARGTGRHVPQRPAPARSARGGLAPGGGR